MTSGAAVSGLFREQLREAADELVEELGIPSPRLEGKLLRPVLARAAAPDGLWEGRPFLAGALAVQVVHEASLLHDDILDASETRRGKPSIMARKGIGAALVEGDHLLTAAYRLAHATGSDAFLGLFIRAVERTVAGERRQCGAMGRSLSEAEYQEIIAAKSGELFGCAVALPACLTPGADIHRPFAIGVQIGQLYQMVDDFLDLCPGADLGKRPFQDYRQRKWTWPLAEAGLDGFERDEEELARLLFHSGGSGPSPMRSALRRLELKVARVQSEWVAEFPTDSVLPELLDRWTRIANATLVREEASDRRSPGAGGREADFGVVGFSEPDVEAAIRSVRAQARALSEEGGWLTYFARHSRSFRFSARLFPAEEGRLVAGVYAFCRFTDDLVDDAPGLSPTELGCRLEAWRRLVRQAYAAADSGVVLLDEILGETARRDVPSLYAEELIRGVAMDLEPGEFTDLTSLRRYSYRVASVVGLWLTELFGTTTPRVLSRAEAMGHAMQLTNILRDVGEDLRRGRLYLPLDHLERHGITRQELEAAAMDRHPLPSGYPDLMEELMEVAEADYAAAAEAIPALPIFFQRPVAVAGRVYQGIHGEIRKNGYDNLSLRAYTSFSRKVVLGGRGLWDLRSARRRYASSEGGLAAFSSSALRTASRTR